MAGLTLPDGEFDEWQRLYLFSDPRSLSLGACNQSIRLYRWKGYPLSKGVLFYEEGNAMKFDDSKRWVLVTGASGGIGQAICRTLAMAGFNVLAGVRPGGTIVAPAIVPHVNLIDLDLAASEQVETIRERVAERTGGSLYGLGRGINDASGNPVATRRPLCCWSVMRKPLDRFPVVVRHSVQPACSELVSTVRPPRLPLSPSVPTLETGRGTAALLLRRRSLTSIYTIV